MKKNDAQISEGVLKLARKMAQKRNCTPDEMISKALQQYRDRLERWQDIQREFQKAGNKAGLRTLDDVDQMIHDYRAEQAKKSQGRS